jgi:hypothetical protein
MATFVKRVDGQDVTVDTTTPSVASQLRANGFEERPPRPPARSASKQAWLDYALAAGVDEAEAAAASRDDLAARFTDPDDPA